MCRRKWRRAEEGSIGFDVVQHPDEQCCRILAQAFIGIEKPRIKDCKFLPVPSHRHRMAVRLSAKRARCKFSPEAG